jgi:hypothetical protein
MIIAVFIIPILLLTSACNLSYTVPQTGMPPSDKTNPPMAPASTATDTPTHPPSPSPSTTLTPTPPKPSLWVATDTNCRTGPGKVYDWIGGIQVGETADNFGRDPGGQYYYISNPDKVNDFCWIWGAYATPTGDLSGLPVFTPPPTPTSLPTDTPTATPTATSGIIFRPPPGTLIPFIFRVTGVTIGVDQVNYVGPCPHPITFSGSITTNGAGTVTYHYHGSVFWSDDIHLTFSAAGTKYVTIHNNEFFDRPAASTWIELHVTSPNAVTSNRFGYSVDCTP